VPPLDGRPQTGPQRWVQPTLMLEVGHAEGDVARFVLSCEVGYAPRDRVRCVGLEETEQTEKSPFAQHREQKRRQGKVGLLEQGGERRPSARTRDAQRPAAQRRATGEDLDVAGFVSRLNREHLQHLAEVRVNASQEARWDNQRDLLVFDQVGHHLHHGSFDLRWQVEGRRPLDGGGRVPLIGGGLGVQTRRQFGPDQVLFFDVEVQGRTAGFDQRTARREAPARSRSGYRLIGGGAPCTFRRCAPRSSPRSSRSIIGGGNTSSSIVKTERIDGALQRDVTAGPTGAPGFEPFQVEQWSQHWIGVRHAQQKLAEPIDHVPGGAGTHGHIAVVERRGLGQHARRTAGQGPLATKPQVIPIDHARRIYFAGAERTRRITLTAHVVAVQANAHIEAAHQKISARHQAGRAQMSKRQQRGLRGVDGPDADGLVTQVCQGCDRAVGADDDH
jgi:hypothetical protein